MRRAEFQMTNEKNQPLFRALEVIARRTLLEDNKNKIPADYANEPWAAPFQLTVNGTTMRGQLIDLQGRINLNSLGEQAAQNPEAPTAKALTVNQLRFIRLLQTLDIEDLDLGKATAITEAISDWIDADDEVSGFGGAENDYYADQTPASRPANTAIADISEIRMVKGMTDEIYRKLSPHITVWPLGGSGEININSASRNVLASFNNDTVTEPLGDVELDWLEDVRDDGRFPSLEVFQQGPFQNRNINTADASEQSSYFLLIGEIVENDVKHYAQAVLYRDQDTIKVVSRTLSGYALPQGITDPKPKSDEDEDFELSIGDEKDSGITGKDSNNDAP
jgi:general secretion pathway protein K